MTPGSARRRAYRAISHMAPWRAFRSLGLTSAALLLALVAGAVVMSLLGVSWLNVYRTLFRGTVTDAAGIGEVLYRATLYTFTGLAVALPYHAGLLNIGAEGQLALGSLATAWVALAFSFLPGPLVVLLALAAGALVGGLWGAIPGLLKVRTGSHEVITTIMMNFVAAGLIDYLLTARLAVPQTLHTPAIAPSSGLAPLGRFIAPLAGSPANTSLVLAVVLGAALALFLWRTAPGLELRAVGANPAAARRVGIRVGRATVCALGLGGALAGLAGANTVLGSKHYYELGLGGGAGFLGIAVALLARNNPLGILPVALFFGVLSYGGLVVNLIVPREVIQILQALALIALLVVAGLRDTLARTFLRRVTSPRPIIPPERPLPPASCRETPAPRGSSGEAAC